MVNAYIQEQDLSHLDFTGPYEKHSGRSGVFFENVFIDCQMQGCDLTNCNLSECTIMGVDLSGSILYNTDFEASSFSSSNLDDADMRNASLQIARLDAVSLARANVTEAMFNSTAIHNVDLSSVVGLGDTYHYRPSAIDSVSLRLTAQGLASEPEFRRKDFFKFLSGTGLDDELLEAVRSWIGQPIEFHSIFLSHSSRDKEFARKLYGDLRSLKIKCWLDEKELLPGDSILGQIDTGIKLWDRLLLVCSRNSLAPTTGWWVEQELERALAKERKPTRLGVPGGTVIPITIDDYIFDEWDGKYKATLLERYIGDFRDHRPESYAESLRRLTEALDRSRRP